MGGQMGGGMPQRPEMQDERYRAMRLSGVFGDPQIASMMQQIQSLIGGGGNVPISQFEGGARIQAPSAAATSVQADPAAALLLQLFGGGGQPQQQAGQGMNGSAAAPGTNTMPPSVMPQQPAGAPPFTATTPPELLPQTGPAPAPSAPTQAAPSVNPFAAFLPLLQLFGIEAGGDIAMGGSQGPQGPAGPSEAPGPTASPEFTVENPVDVPGQDYL